jgi:hypothetical protein
MELKNNIIRIGKGEIPETAALGIVAGEGLLHKVEKSTVIYGEVQAYYGALAIYTATGEGGRTQSGNKDLAKAAIGRL